MSDLDRAFARAHRKFWRTHTTQYVYELSGGLYYVTETGDLSARLVDVVRLF